MAPRVGYFQADIFFGLENIFGLDIFFWRNLVDLDETDPNTVHLDPDNSGSKITD